VAAGSPGCGPVASAIPHDDEELKSGGRHTRRAGHRLRRRALAADGVANSQIAASVGVAPVTDRWWQSRFASEGMAKVAQEGAREVPGEDIGHETVFRVVGPGDRLLTSRTITSAPELRAAIKRVCEDGWSFVDQELEEGLRSLSVPIRDNGGRVLAAANLSLHPSRATMSFIRGTLLDRLKATAIAIEKDLAPQGSG